MKTNNPNGRPKEIFPMPGVRYETRATIKHCIDMLGAMTGKELAIIINNPMADVRTLAYAKLWLRVINHGCSKTLGELMDRSIGKVREEKDTEEFTPEKYTAPPTMTPDE